MDNDCWDVDADKRVWDVASCERRYNVIVRDKVTVLINLKFITSFIKVIQTANGNVRCFIQIVATVKIVIDVTKD